MKNIKFHIGVSAYLLIVAGCTSQESNISKSNTSSPMAFQSIVGKWRNEITVPPNNNAYTNMITFNGGKEKGAFLDQNNHSGSWQIKGDSITWIYEGVADLTNTFTGKLSENLKSMNGINYGVWQEEEFKGTWKATRE